MSYRSRLILILIGLAAVSALFMGVLGFRIMRHELETAAIGWAQDIAVSTAHFLERSGVTLEKLKADPQLLQKSNTARETMDLESIEAPSIWESTVIAVPEQGQWRIVARLDPPGSDYSPVGSLITIDPLDDRSPAISVTSRGAGWYRTPRNRWFGAFEPFAGGQAVVFIGARASIVTGILLQIFETTAVAFGLVAIVGVAVAWPLSSRMVRPVEQIRQFASALDQGRFEARLAPHGPPEIRTLFRELNRFARHLGERAALQARNRQLAGTLEGQHARVEAMSSLEIDFAQLSDFDLLMGRVLETLPRLTHAGFCGVFLPEGGEFSLNYAARDGHPAHGEAAVGHTCKPGGLLARAIAESTAHAERLGAEDGAWVESAALAGAAAAAIAMKSGSGATLGVAVIARDPGAGLGAFTAQELADLRHVATLVSMALERREASENMLWRMVRMAETRDPSETGSHVKRVAATALEIFDGWAKRRGMRDAEFQFARSMLRMAAILHDVGKVGISDLVLKKPGKLTDEEYGVMKRHTVLGAALLPGHGPHDEAAREVAMHHHERWDGRGYPGPVESDGGADDIQALLNERLPSSGISGENIPLFARIVAIADVYDALSSRRAYKEPWSPARVEEEMRSQGGKAFDQELLDIFFERIDRIREARARYPDRAPA